MEAGRGEVDGWGKGEEPGARPIDGRTGMRMRGGCD